RTLWPEKRMVEVNATTFDQVALTAVRSFRIYLEKARAFRYRVVSYRCLCENPELEVARLMAMFPLRIEQQQLLLQPTKPKGGDPKTYAKTEISLSAR